MKKINILKNKLIKTALKMIIAVIICAIILWLMLNYQNDIEDKVKIIDRKINETNADIIEIENATNVYRNSFDLFVDLQAKIDNDKFVLNPEEGSKILELLSIKHRISNLTAEINTEKKIISSDYYGYTPIYRQIFLTFSAMSDAHIYAFLDNIKKYFPGYIDLSKINMTRKLAISEDILVEVSKGTIPELLDAKIELIWLGINVKAEKSNLIKDKI